MILPKVPSWFRNGLKAIDPTLVARFIPDQGWQICQKVRTFQRFQLPDGKVGAKMITRLERILNIPAIGSRAFRDIRMFHASRFRTYEDMCKELNIRYE